MSQLNKVPPGYLSVFNLQTLGRAPVEIADAITPAFDVSRLYMVDMYSLLETVVTIDNGTSDDEFLPGSVALTVPSNELWLPTCASLALTAETATGDAGYAPAFEPAMVGVSSIMLAAPSGLANVGTCNPFLGQMILTPGDRLGVLAIRNAITAGAYSIRASFQVVKLRY